MNPNSSPEPVHLEPVPISHHKPKRFRKAAKRAVFASSLLALGLTGVGTWKFRSSLPALSGKHVTTHVVESVKIDRDAMGIPTIHATSRTDAAYALGFAHAQDRFFQMDLLRRVPAGRLAELVGKSAVGADKRYRKHRFSDMAEKVFAKADKEHQLILEAYCRGVNEGLQKLDDEPFEYQVLQATPEPWKPTDSFLVMVTMLCDLQPMDGSPEQALTLLHEKVPQEVFDYLVRAGSRWDAALDDSKLTQPSIPGPEVWSLRGGKSNDQAASVWQNRPELDPTELAWLNSSHLLDPITGPSAASLESPLREWAEPTAPFLLRTCTWDLGFRRFGIEPSCALRLETIPVDSSWV
jgi:acyl-homoserine lactone acylase PvdQ